MLFVKKDKLKVGMRLAKPIYDKKGVLLYERDSKLTRQGIESVGNFGLIGLYILEPAEPVPPMTEDDLEFERFQTVSVFAIREELESMQKDRKAPKINPLAANIIKNYGRLDHKINFVQSLRSDEDYVYKHTLNVAILSAMIAHAMNLHPNIQIDVVTAAIAHDIGKLFVSKTIREKKREDYTPNDLLEIQSNESMSGQIAEEALASPRIRRIISQSWKSLNDWNMKKVIPDSKIVTGAKVLMVAEVFDTMTAMNHYKEPSSEITALRYLLQYPSVFSPEAVDALVNSINLLSKGCCVELTNGEKGLVIQENAQDFLNPIVLCFRDNTIIDLSNKIIYDDLEIKDIMKTMDNRVVIDMDRLN